MKTLKRMEKFVETLDSCIAPATVSTLRAVWPKYFDSSHYLFSLKENHMPPMSLESGQMNHHQSWTMLHNQPTMEKLSK